MRSISESEAREIMCQTNQFRVLSLNEYSRLVRLLTLRLSSYSYTENLDEPMPVHVRKLAFNLDKLVSLGMLNVQIEGIQSPIAKILQWLSDLGEFYKLKGGYYMPTPARLVTFPQSELVALLGWPYDTAERSSFLRLINPNEVHGIPKVPCENWCSLPKMDSWLERLIGRGIESDLNIDVESIDVRKNEWTFVGSASKLRGVHIVRDERENRNLFLVKVSGKGKVTYTYLKSQDRLRTFYAVKIFLGIPNGKVLVEKISEGQISVKLVGLVLPNEELKHFMALGWPVHLNVNKSNMTEWLFRSETFGWIERVLVNLGCKTIIKGLI